MAFVVVIGEQHPIDDGLTGVEVHEIEQAPRQPARGLARPAAQDPTVGLAIEHVEPHRTDHGVVGLRPPPPLHRRRDRVVELVVREARHHPPARVREHRERTVAHRARKRIGQPIGRARERARLAEPRDVLVESPQHRIEQVGAVVVRLHAVGEVNVDGRLGTDRVEMRAQGRVELPVDQRERIPTEPAHEGRIVTRMARIVQMPELMARTVALTQHVEVKIPATAREQVHRERTLARESVAQGGDELGGLVGVANVRRAVEVVAGRELRTRTLAGNQRDARRIGR